MAERISARSVRAAVGALSAVYLYRLGPEPPVPQFVAREGIGRDYRDDMLVHRCRYLVHSDITVVDGMTVTTAGRTLRDLIGHRAVPDVVARFAVEAAYAKLGQPAEIADAVAPVLAAGERTVHDGPVLLLKIAALIDYLPPYMDAHRMRSTAWSDGLPVTERVLHTRQTLLELLTAARQLGIRSDSSRIPPVIAPPTAPVPSSTRPARSALSAPIPAHDRDLLTFGDRDGHGRFGILDDDGNTVLCHECGQRFKCLTAHVARIHSIPVRDYKIRHGLPLTLPLLAQTSRDKQSHSARRHHNAATMQALRTRVDPDAQRHNYQRSATYRSAHRLREGREQLSAGTRRTIHTCPICGTQWTNRRTGSTRRTCSEPCRRRLTVQTSRQNRRQRTPPPPTPPDQPVDR